MKKNNSYKNKSSPTYKFFFTTKLTKAEKRIFLTKLVFYFFSKLITKRKLSPLRKSKFQAKSYLEWVEEEDNFIA